MNETETFPKVMTVRVPVYMTSIYYVEVDVDTDGETTLSGITSKALDLVEANANMDAQRNPWNNTIIFTCDFLFEAGAGEIEIADYAPDFVFDQVYEQASEED
jgi:hypothetical protein